MATFKAQNFPDEVRKSFSRQKKRINRFRDKKMCVNSFCDKKGALIVIATKKVCVNHLCNKTSVLKSFLQQKSVRKSFSRQKKYLKLQFDVQVRIICCFCNVLSSNHAWLYILGKAHTQLPFLTHLILVPSLGCVFLMRTCYQLIEIRQNLKFFFKACEPNYCSTKK